MFSYSGSNRLVSNMTRVFRPVHQVAAPGRSAPSPTASYFDNVVKILTIMEKVHSFCGTLSAITRRGTFSSVCLSVCLSEFSACQTRDVC